MNYSKHLSFSLENAYKTTRYIYTTGPTLYAYDFHVSFVDSAQRCVRDQWRSCAQATYLDCTLNIEAGTRTSRCNAKI